MIYFVNIYCSSLNSINGIDTRLIIPQLMQNLLRLSLDGDGTYDPPIVEASILCTCSLIYFGLVQVDQICRNQTLGNWRHVQVMFLSKANNFFLISMILIFRLEGSDVCVSCYS